MNVVWKDLLPPNFINNILYGSNVPTGKALVNHPLVSKVSLTGSTETGIHIAKQTSDTLKRTTLELGGKSPLLIFDDFSLESAVQIAMESNYTNNGQVCSNATRIFVQNTILEEFITLLKQRLDEQVVTGHPIDPQTNIGPMMMHPTEPSKHFNSIMGYLKRASIIRSIR
jgi:betaine-aldehyde dehydrogenase